jgi:hypothetical protein
MKLMMIQQQRNLLRIAQSKDRWFHYQQSFVRRPSSCLNNTYRSIINTFTRNDTHGSLISYHINNYRYYTALLCDKKRQQEKNITVQQNCYTKRWKSTTTSTNVVRNNNNGKKRRKARTSYDSNIPLDGLFRPGMTTPLKIKLNHYSSSIGFGKDDTTTSTSTATTGTGIATNNNDDIIKYTKMITNLLTEYHTKIKYRREDVCDMLRTNPDFIQLLPNLEQLLLQHHPTNNNNNHNEIQNNDTTNNSSNGNKTTPRFYTIWENIDIESLLKLRVDIENWIGLYEVKKLDTYLIYNDLNDNVDDQIKYQQNEIELHTMKRYMKLIIQVLLYYIPNYITVRQILPKDVTVDLIRVSTVHDELPIHYNIHFNPFTGVTNRVYGVYLTNVSQTKDRIIPSRILEPSPEQQQNLNEPIVILCVSLQSKVPRSLREIFCPEIPVTTNSSSSTTTTNTTSSIQQIELPKHVATFYSIKNVQHEQYSKLKIGEYLIHESVRMLQDESTSITSTTTTNVEENDNEIDIIRVKNETTTTSSKTITPIDTFVTLSPIPGFGMWLRNEMDICTMYCSSDYGHDEQHGHGIIRKKSSLYHTIQFLSRQWHCTEEDVLTKITDLLYVRSNKERQKEKSKSQRKKKNGDDNNTEHILSSAAPNSSPQINAAIRYFLEGMAAHYIVNVKISDTNGTTTMTSTTETYKPSNGVARFHLQNGAEVYRVNAFADLSISGIHDSYSVMVNYRYNISQLQYNQKHYETNYSVAIHEYVKQQLQ